VCVLVPKSIWNFSKCFLFVPSLRIEFIFRTTIVSVCVCVRVLNFFFFFVNYEEQNAGCCKHLKGARLFNE